jgi:hypothetical protein
MTSGVRSAPAASSTLSGVPLAHALIYIRNNKLSGVLELRTSNDQHAWLAFWRGLVVSSMTTPIVARFGTVVYELGIIDARTLDATTQEAANDKRPLMDLMLERGLITEAQRGDILAEQTARRVHHLFSLPPSTTFTFREGRPSTSEPIVIVDPMAPVWRGLRDFPPDARIAEVLARVGDCPLRLVSRDALERAELTAKELALCEALAQSPRRVSDLRTESRLPRARVDLLAYFLVITKCVEVEGAERAPIPTGSMWAVRGAAKSTASASSAITATSTPRANDPMQPHTSSARVASAHPLPPRGPTEVGAVEIRRRAAELAMETPVATLGLTEGASAEAARAAYFRLARLWNPERLPRELEEVRDEVTRIFARMTEAHTLLTDPATRRGVVSRTSS